MLTDKMLASRVVLISGDEDLLRREAIKEIMAQANIQPDDFDLEMFAGDASTPMDWSASVGTSPFLADRRMVIVRHLLRCDIDKAKTVDFKKLPPSSLLVLVADDVSGGDDRIQRAKTQRTAWEKLVSKSEGVVIQCNSDPKVLKGLIKKRAIDHSITISDRGIDALVEMTAGSLSRAFDELDKIALFVGDKGQISESDVRRVAVPSREWNVYRMVDSIVSGEVGEALRQLRILVGSSSKAEDAAFSRILPTVSRQLKLIWQGRLCVENNCSPGNATESIRALFPDRPNLGSEPPYRQSATMTAAKRLTFPKLEKCFGILADTDARLKGALDAFSNIETLERMVLEMAETISKK